jgi:hypothetical protein
MFRIARFSRWTLGLVAALVALCATVGLTNAAPGAAPNPPNPSALTGQYRAQQQQLRAQDMRLAQATQHAAKIDVLIAKLKSKGQDTAALEQAVAAFRASMAQARAAWQAASDTLALHAGFDNDGKVTNADQARATLAAAGASMRQVHQIAVDAYKALHRAIVAYRQAHRDVPEPAEPPAP